MPTASAIGKPYCPQCGWNRDVAEKQTRLLLRLLPALVILFDAPLIVWIFVGHAEAPMLAALAGIAIVPAILVVLVVKGKIRLGASGPKKADAVLSRAGTTQIAAPNEEVAEQYKLLAELPRPRPVRMSRQGKMNVVVISIALIAFAAALIAMSVMQPAAGRSNATPLPRPVIFVLPIGLVILIMFVMQRALERQYKLLVYGELAMARVTKQWIARNGHGIRYEFTTPAGENFSRMTSDSTRQLFEGMTVPIFFDQQQPKKQVALCASFYEIILRGQR
jgi:hypothetical protein